MGTGAMIKRHAVVYAHYPGTQETPRYVWAALRQFLELAEIVVLVVAGRERVQLPESLSGRIQCICRPNQGWDFASYRMGISALSELDISTLTLCNDSVYGPLFPMTRWYVDMKERNVDAWGITTSDELQWHLQSYFLCFRGRALASKAFTSFWSQTDEISDRRQAIRSGEINLSQVLLEDGLALASICEDGAADDREIGKRIVLRGLRGFSRRWRQQDFYRDVFSWLMGETRVGTNPSLERWETLLREERLPFVKRRALDKPSAYERFQNAILAHRTLVCRDVLEAIAEDRDDASVA